MPKYRIKATVTVEMYLPDDFDPNRDNEGDILYSLDGYVRQDGVDGWRLWKAALADNGMWHNDATYKIVE
jgi:hypothetical protein